MTALTATRPPRCVPSGAFDLFRAGAAWTLLAGLALAGTAQAQTPSPLARVEAMGVETAEVGRVEVYFAPSDRERALELAALSAAAADFFERELGFSLDHAVAALSPDDWFSEFPGMPYAIPWASMPERLILMPSSLEEGLLIEGRDPLEDRRTVDFVLLHELGHLAAKAYYRPASESDYLPVKWFEELLANCFAYAFVRASDPEWARADELKWQRIVDGFTPPVVSLDWSFMNGLPPGELARVYAWYQNLLNLRAAELHAEHGLGFLRSLRDGLDWPASDGWTTESLLPALEAVAPGFGAWAADPGSLRRQHAGSPEATIRRLAVERSEALVGKDLAALDRILAPEFVYTNASGEVLDKDGYLERYVRDPEVRWLSQELADVEVRIFGDSALVTCRAHDRAVFHGRSLDATFRSTYVYVRQGAGWRCVAGHTGPAGG